MNNEVVNLGKERAQILMLLFLKGWQGGALGLEENLLSNSVWQFVQTKWRKEVNAYQDTQAQ